MIMTITIPKTQPACGGIANRSTPNCVTFLIFTFDFPVEEQMIFYLFAIFASQRIFIREINREVVRPPMWALNYGNIYMYMYIKTQLTAKA